MNGYLKQTRVAAQKPGHVAANDPGITPLAGVRVLRHGEHLLDARIADTWLDRLKGLFACGKPKAADALVLSPCYAVHTVGLTYAIDVVFIDPYGHIVKCVRLRPFSVALCWRAFSVIEMAAGNIERLQLCVGQQLTMEEPS